MSFVNFEKHPILATEFDNTGAGWLGRLMGAEQELASEGTNAAASDVITRANQIAALEIEQESE